ncbi:MAG: hypothetical protein FWC03_11540 [Treponema sp.]|nr:hypothetical protein [Treponema sp.]
MILYTTWITEKDGRVDRIMQNPGDKSPGPQWRKVPNDWKGNHNDDLSWFDDSGRRIPNSKLIEKGDVIDNRGRWFHKENIGESIQVYNLGDDAPGKEWTKEEPLKDEPYQKWDSKKNKFIIDMEKKEECEKAKSAFEKKSAIQAAEQRIQRSLIAKISGKATDADDEYFNKYSAEIENLRIELNQLEGR